MQSVQVYCDSKRYADAYPLEVPEHVDFEAINEPPADDAPKTGLNYLELLKEKSEQGLSYSKEGK